MSGSNLISVNAATGRGKYRLFSEAKLVGNDIIILIWGGTKPHIGSVCVALPRPSCSNPHNNSSTSSVYNFPAHKDDLISKMFGEKIAATFNTNTVTTAGIHLPDITKSGLNKIIKNAEILCSLLIKKLERLNWKKAE